MIPARTRIRHRRRELDRFEAGLRLAIKRRPAREHSALVDGTCPICGADYESRVEHLVEEHGYVKPGHYSTW